MTATTTRHAPPSAPDRPELQSLRRNPLGDGRWMVEARRPAMGTTAHLILVVDDPAAGDELLGVVARRLGALEQLWSRFIDSEVAQLNRRGGDAVPVSAETRLLVSMGLRAHAATGGLFDPTVQRAMVANGYDRSFVEIAGLPPDPGQLAFDQTPFGGESSDVVPAPGCLGITVDDAEGTVRLPEGVGFDPGGIGKGLAADLLAAHALSLGASGALVNIGGDLRALGSGPDGAWVVEIVEPALGFRATVAIGEGAVATSTDVRRRWNHDGATRHHLIDPATGRPARCGLSLVTTVSAEAWWAEAAAKAVYLAGVAVATAGTPQWLEHLDALAVADDGTAHQLGNIQEYLT